MKQEKLKCSIVRYVLLSYKEINYRGVSLALNVLGYHV